DQRRVPTEVAHVPHASALLLYSLTVSAIGTTLALLLGIGPAALLGGMRRKSRKVEKSKSPNDLPAGVSTFRRFDVSTFLHGLCIAPLLIPPQVYAYALGLATAPHRLLSAALPPVSGVGA